MFYCITNVCTAFSAYQIILPIYHIHSCVPGCIQTPPHTHIQRYRRELTEDWQDPAHS